MAVDLARLSMVRWKVSCGKKSPKSETGYRDGVFVGFMNINVAKGHGGLTPFGAPVTMYAKL